MVVIGAIYGLFGVILLWGFRSHAYVIRIGICWSILEDAISGFGIRTSVGGLKEPNNHVKYLRLQKISSGGET